MREEFCTLFDANYLTRALVLHRSLVETCHDFRLRAFCMDEQSKQLLDRLALPNVSAIALEELESHDADLAAVKPSRTPVEFCWTATPAACLFALEREPELDAITYLDADMMFFSHPRPLFEEFAEDSVMIVPHRYPPEWEEWADWDGIYNVGLVAFRRDDRALEVLRWWRERCLEWCFRRHEDGKFGDQKYLDDWPERFAGVHVLRHPGGGLGPWNARRYRLECRDGRLTVDGDPVVFYHYQGLSLYKGVSALRTLGLRSKSFEVASGPVRLIWATDPVWQIEGGEKELLWRPYVQRLSEALAAVRAIAPGFEEGFTELRPRTFLYDGIKRLVPPSVRRAIRRTQRIFTGGAVEA
jgi:hypothetical protein